MTLPFTSIVGLDAAKQALLLLAVNPALGGAAMAATVGSGKSTLARAFAALLPDGSPFVELPLNTTEDRLLGGLDLEATLATGRRVVEPGLMAKAHGGALYIDGMNLLDKGVVAQLLAVMAAGVVRVEREGLSAVHPAQFVLVGTYDSSDGDMPRSLLDRMGLIVPFAPQNDAGARAEVVRRNDHRNDDADEEVAILRAMVALAREQLPQVRIRDEQIAGLANTALSLGVEGNRADVFAVQAALAKAALDGRGDVDDDDLKLAVRLVLAPRATQLPQDAGEPEQQSPSQQPQASADASQPDDPSNEEQQRPEQTQEQIEELLLSAAEAELPADVLTLPFAMQRRGRSGSRGATMNSKRGRYVAAVEGELRGNRIALLPTLMAAAPWQKVRRLENRDSRLGIAGISIENRKSKIENPKSPISIRKSDVRIKRYRDKAGMLYIFVVDASGSMALNRMREAKGAAIHLLQDAYVHRDQVALIAFRGAAAQTLLEPSQSVERAKRELDVLPTGGGTPLASALMTAWQTALAARSKGIAQSTVVLMTDGRANVALNAQEDAAPGRQQLQDEVKTLAGLLQGAGINAVVIDTQANYLSRGEAPKLAQWLHGRYVYLPNAKAAQIANAVTSRSEQSVISHW
jgi:magnesium chelatase subunit D